MLKKYRNHLYGIIQEKGLDPKLFHGEDKTIDDDRFFVIELRNSPLYFRVKDVSYSFDLFSYWYTSFDPNFPLRIAGSSENLTKLKKDFVLWLDNHVKSYIEEQVEPDLWERIVLQEPLGAGSELVSEDINVFSDDEKVRLRMSINEFRLLVVKNFKPSSEELKVINDRLEYLSDAVDRLNKFDWRGVAIMTLIQISLILTLDSEKISLLINLFKQVFSVTLYLIQ